MSERRIARTTMLAFCLAYGLPQLGCATQEQPSAVVGAYILSRDSDGERRVLRIESSSEQSAECMQADMPTDDNVPWKEIMLDPALHRALIDLLFDEARFPRYEADTDASASAETFVCTPGRHGSDFCYVPQVTVTGVSSPWRFGLRPDVTLSDESKELIDEFLSAHDACWNAGTSMSGGG
jgi:hypothetical protein